MEAFPSLDELLLNPVVAAAAVVAAVNVLSYAAGGVKPTWLAVVTSLGYMVGGYLVTGRTAPDQLFLAVVYALLIVAPLAHVDGAVLHRLFGGTTNSQLPFGQRLPCALDSLCRPLLLSPRVPTEARR